MIHTSGPIYRNEADPDAVLLSSYNNCLRLALDNQCRSIAFPAISCGAYGFPIDKAAIIALNACLEPAYERLNIFFYLFDDHTYQVWLQTYQDLTGQ